MSPRELSRRHAQRLQESPVGKAQRALTARVYAELPAGVEVTELELRQAQLEAYASTSRTERRLLGERNYRMAGRPMANTLRRRP